VYLFRPTWGKPFTIFFQYRQTIIYLSMENNSVANWNKNKREDEMKGDCWNIISTSSKFPDNTGLPKII